MGPRPYHFTNEIDALLDSTVEIQVEKAIMLTFVIALCNVAIGASLAVVATVIAPLFVSGHAIFGLVLILLVISISALVLLLDWFDGRIKNALFDWIEVPKPVVSSSANANVHPVYWGALGFCLGLAASAVWTPGAVLDVFRVLVN